MRDHRDDIETATTREIADYVDSLADGDSNDKEISALRGVIDELLARLGDDA